MQISSVDQFREVMRLTAQQLQIIHYAVATSDNRDVSGGLDSHTARLVRFAIRAAWPDVCNAGIREVVLDSGESLDYAARWVQDNGCPVHEYGDCVSAKE